MENSSMRILKIFIIFLAVFSFLIGVLNISVITRQCSNYECRDVKIPLYLKILDFFDRHYNYMQLSRQIIKGAKSEQDKALIIFEWTYKNIKPVPVGYPVIDDHVWHIIVRGFGAVDQVADVFATLCNYSGLDAFYSLYSHEEQSGKGVILCFVRIRGKWYCFDPYRGAYFREKQTNGLIDIDSIKSGRPWVVEGLNGNIVFDYSIYMQDITEVKKFRLKRSNIQSPLRRLKFEIKERLLNS